MDTCALVQAVSATILPNVGGLWMAFVNKRALREWYYKLNMPKNFPSNWVFGTMWTSLNTSMGYTSYMVWRDGGGLNGAARYPLMVYGAHLGLNWALSPIYFGARSVKWVK
jgi:translocator protein